MELKTQIEKTLRAHGVKPTTQRTEIGMLLFKVPTHMSAEQIIVDLRAAGSRVSKATVYNTLNLFSQHGLVREVSVDPERRFYDSTNTAHHHFYNVDSGELTDIHADEVQFSRFPDLPEGTLADSVDVVIKVRNKA
ncbi:MAG: Fur family transcriptional regulator [Gammaproteobacteria bacterium]